ncbi:MAG: O-antigen ligase family protein [Bacteroidota bacterium]
MKVILNNKKRYLDLASGINAVLSFLLVENSIIAVLLADRQYSIISHSLLFLLLFVFSLKKKLLHFTSFVTIFIIVTFGLAFHYYVYRDYTLLYMLAVPQSIIIGYIFFLNLKSLPLKFIFYFNCFLFIAYIFLFTEEGGNTEFLRRTTYTTILCHFWFFLAVKDFIHKKRVDLLPTIFFFLLSVVSYSRIGIGISLFVFFVYLFRYFQKNLKRFLLVAILLVLSLSLFFIFFDINDVPAFQRFSSRGLGTGRYELWEWYINDLDDTKFLVGYDQFYVWDNLSRMLKNPDVKYTMHNSYLQFHALIGVFGLIVFVIFFLNFLKWILINKSSVMASIFLSYFGIAFFSTIMLPQRYDYVFFSVLFLLIMVNSKTRLFKIHSAP